MRRNLPTFTTIILLFFIHVVGVAGVVENCVQYRSITDPISAAFTAFLINAWNTSDGFFTTFDEDNLVAKAYKVLLLIGFMEIPIGISITNLYKYSLLRQAGLTRQQAALVVRKRILVTRRRAMNLQLPDPGPDEMLEDVVVKRPDFETKSNYDWLIRNRNDIFPSDKSIRRGSGNSTLASIVAALQTIWSLINGIERLAHGQALSGLDAIGLQFAVPGIIYAIDAILIPKIKHKGIALISANDFSDDSEARNEDIKSGNTDFKDDIFTIPQVLITFVAMVVVDAFGFWLQMQVDFPSHTLRVAALACYLGRFIFMLIAVCFISKNDLVAEISLFFIITVSISWFTLCWIGFDRSEILVKTLVSFNWPRI